MGADAASWEAVHAQVEEATGLMEQSAAGAPTDPTRDAAEAVAQTLRSTYFAFESARLLRSAAQAPTPEQLIQADALSRSTAEDLRGALARLEEVVSPEPDDLSGVERGTVPGPPTAPGDGPESAQ
jgi:hypothetical protein